MFKSELKEKDIFLTSSATINQICEPLKKIGISYITYLRNYQDGSQINLSNCADWIEHYYKFKLYKSSQFEKEPQGYSSGLFLWPEESNLEVFKHGRNYFDSDNGVTVVEKSETYTEFFFFSGSRKNRYLKNLYVNNQDLIENFIKYFKERLKDIISEAENSRILIPREYQESMLEEDEITKFIEQELSELKRQFTLNTQKKVIPIFQDREVFALLSPREVSIVSCLLEGKTAKETAKRLSISNRTVETHLENIKIKLNCRTKFELVNKIFNSSQKTT